MRRNNARNGPAIAGSDAFQSRSHFVTPFGLTPDDASVSFAQPRFQASVRLGLGERRKFFQEVDPREPPFGFDGQGCDVYTRTVYGARTSVAVGVLATLGVATRTY